MLYRKTLLWSGIMAALLLAPLACQYSPFEIEPDCERNSIARNLERLKGLEAQLAGRDFFKVGLLTDPQLKPDDLAAVVNKLNARDDIDFVLVLGDLTENGLELEYEWSCKSLEKLNYPYLAIVGNHDAISFGKQIWQDFFGPFDYVFHFLGTKFIAYNANTFEFPEAPDFAWIEAAAAMEPGEVRLHTIGLSHQPPVPDVQSFEEVQALKQLLANNGFEYTLHGHRGPDFWRDEFGVVHLIQADVDDERYGTMTVFQDRVEFEACDPDCRPISPRQE